MTQADMLEAKTDLSRLVRSLETRQEDVVYIRCCCCLDGHCRVTSAPCC